MKLRTGEDGRPAVHPVADLFPMMGEEETAELAADIAANGLAHPVVLAADGTLIDGRNRLAACAAAGVEPSFEVWDGEDAAAYILSSNLARRFLTKGQAAMVAAKARALFREIGSPVSGDFLARQSGISAQRVSAASVVLEHAPGLADAVIAGALGLDEAYAKAREIKTAAESDEARLAQLRAEAPDLADKVTDGELTLAGALAEQRARAERDRKTAIAYQTVIYQPAISLAQLFAGQDAEQIGEHMAAFPHLYEDGRQAEELEQAAHGLLRAAGAWRKHEQAHPV